MIEVFENDCQRAEGAEELVTYGVYSCLVLALRIRGRRIGYLGHFLSDDNTMNHAERLVDQALSEAGNAKMVSAWPGGCAPFHYSLPETLAAREGTTELLQERGIRVVRTFWLPDEDTEIRRLRMDCESGKVIEAYRALPPLTEMDY